MLRYEFEAKQTFTVYALGRPVNPRSNGGRLQVPYLNVQTCYFLCHLYFQLYIFCVLIHYYCAHIVRVQTKHVLRIWDMSTRRVLAVGTVSDQSPVDQLGYAFVLLDYHDRYTRKVVGTKCLRLTRAHIRFIVLHNRVELESGKRYRLTSTERSGSGDPWYDKAQRGREQVCCPRPFLFFSHF